MIKATSKAYTIDDLIGMTRCCGNAVTIKQK